MLPIRYSMRNIINGTPVTITGDGVWLEEGQMAINLTISDVRPDWSGAVGPCICSGPGPGQGLTATQSVQGMLGFAPNGYRTQAGTLRRATLFDDEGTQIAAVSATGIYEKTATEFKFSIEVETETKPDSIISQLATIDDYRFIIIPNGAGRAIVISSYTISALSGRRAFGTTYINYEAINSSSFVDEILTGMNIIKFNQIGSSMQWISKQSIWRTSTLGLDASSVTPIS